MIKKVDLPIIDCQRAIIPADAKEGEYLLCSTDADDGSSGISFDIVSFYNGFLDTGTYIPEEDMVAYAYLGATNVTIEPRQLPDVGSNR